MGRAALCFNYINFIAVAKSLSTAKRPFNITSTDRQCQDQSALRCFPGRHTSRQPCRKSLPNLQMSDCPAVATFGRSLCRISLLSSRITSLSSFQSEHLLFCTAIAFLSAPGFAVASFRTMTATRKRSCQCRLWLLRGTMNASCD